MRTPGPIRAHARRYVETNGLRAGTHSENLAAKWLHRAAVPFVQQHPVGRYRLDFAVVAVKIAIEVDGFHHRTADGALRDVTRDMFLREQGWVVLRVTADDEDQLATVCRLTLIVLEAECPRLALASAKARRARASPAR